MNRLLRPRGLVAAIICAGCGLISRADPLSPATDPGVRREAGNAGAVVAGVKADAFARARRAFNQEHFVEPGDGLGPRFNGTSCGACHAFPATGGSSPWQNPQLEMAAAHGAHNAIPSFLRKNGPVLAVRVRSAVKTAGAGEVLPLFTINGRVDASRCVVEPPDFGNPANLSFRIPTPIFGAGLIDNVEAAEILANGARDGARKKNLGIRGELNVGADGAVGKFGWKAQHYSLRQFADEAYQTEMGVRDPTSGYGDESMGEACYADYYAAFDDPYFSPSYQNEDPPVVLFVEFMRALQPPAPVAKFAGATMESVRNGSLLFDRVGCALCHTPALRTGHGSELAALNHRDASLYSDLCLHHMGPKLADGIVQGQAGPDQFRTAPLWGAGQRVFFLHDGRTADLLAAIQEHASEEGGSRSEANAVIGQFNRLTATEQQDILNFLRSL